MIGLYLHVPFCARRCPYCDFAVHIGATSALQRAYVSALQREIASVCAAHFAQFPDEKIHSVFCGGGTPSALSASTLNAILTTVRECAPIADDAEISLEANPENISRAWLEELQNGGWNRLSLGVQSLDDDVLQVLGRRHTRANVENVAREIHHVGWRNWSLDCIYAVPGQSLASWRDTLERTIELGSTHVSCYSLTIESETAFGRRVARGRMVPMEDDAQADFMATAAQVLAAANFARYEVSNYAREGFECRHNVATWRGGDYLACGVGAHGHRRGHRWWNRRDVNGYIGALENGETARAGEENLDAAQRWDEMVLMGLRLGEGVNFAHIAAQIGHEIPAEFWRRVRELERRNVLENVGEKTSARVRLETATAGEYLPLRSPLVREQFEASATRWRIRPSWLAMADAIALELLR